MLLTKLVKMQYQKKEGKKNVLIGGYLASFRQEEKQKTKKKFEQDKIERAFILNMLKYFSTQNTKKPIVSKVPNL